ncbi:hypothetical protein [Falsiroseomonas sp. CW058]|uniref:hypothetical protein n=1 Tax=Falsiroseomonas sp. CW058 TaxID=3388664 RepID=UPI003D31BB36
MHSIRPIRPAPRSGIVQALKRAAMHRHTIALVNVLILLVLVPALVRFLLGLSAGDDAHDLAKLLDDVATVLVGYGVVVEERHFLMTKLGLYPDMETPEQTATDEICHSVGFAALALGLMSELLVKLVELPNSVVNTEGFDLALLCLTAALIATTSALLVWHALRLVAGPKPR